MSQKNFHIGSITPIKKENTEVFFHIVEALCELEIPISVLAEGDADIQKKCFKFSEKYPKQFEFLENIEKNRTKIIEKSKTLLFLEKPNKETLKEIAELGIVPITPEESDLENFDPQKETGNAFTFQKNNFWKLLQATLRASENFKFQYDWKIIQQNLKKI